MNFSIDMFSDETLYYASIDIVTAVVEEVAQYEEQLMSHEQARKLAIKALAEMFDGEVSNFRSELKKYLENPESNKIIKGIFDDIDLGLGESMELTFAEEG